jgi:hypothetical protein
MEIEYFASRWGGTSPFADACAEMLYDMSAGSAQARFRLCSAAPGALRSAEMLAPMSDACRIACGIAARGDETKFDDRDVARAAAEAIGALDEPASDDPQWGDRQTAAFYVAALAADCARILSERPPDGGIDKLMDLVEAALSRAYAGARASDGCASARVAMAKCLVALPGDRGLSTVRACASDDAGRDAALFAFAYSVDLDAARRSRSEVMPEAACVRRWLPAVASMALSADWVASPRGGDALLSAAASTSAAISRATIDSGTMAVACAVASIVGESSPWGCGFDPVRGPPCAAAASLFFDAASRRACCGGVPGSADAVRRRALADSALEALSVAADSAVATRRRTDPHRGAACAVHMMRCARRAFEADVSRTRDPPQPSFCVVVPQSEPPPRAFSEEDGRLVSAARSASAQVNCCGSRASSETRWLTTGAIARPGCSPVAIESLARVRSVELEDRCTERAPDSEARDFALAAADAISAALSDGGWPVRGASRSTNLPCSRDLEPHDHELRITGPGGLSSISILVDAAIECATSASSGSPPEFSRDFALRLFGKRGTMYESAAAALVAAVASALERSADGPVRAAVSERMAEVCCSVCAWASIATAAGVNRYAAEDLGKRLDFEIASATGTTPRAAYPRRIVARPAPSPSILDSAVAFASGLFGNSRRPVDLEEGSDPHPSSDLRRVAEDRVAELFGSAGKASDGIVCRTSGDDRGQLVGLAGFFSQISVDVASTAARSLSGSLRDPVVASLVKGASEHQGGVGTASLIAMAHLVAGWPGTRIASVERVERLRSASLALSRFRGTGDPSPVVGVLEEMATAASIATAARCPVSPESVPALVDPFGSAEAGRRDWSPFSARWSIRALVGAVSCRCADRSACSCDPLPHATPVAANSIAFALYRSASVLWNIPEDTTDDLTTACAALCSLESSPVAAMAGLAVSCAAVARMARDVRKAIELEADDGRRSSESLARCAGCAGASAIRAIEAVSQRSGPDQVSERGWLRSDAIEMCCASAGEMLDLSLWNDDRHRSRSGAPDYVSGATVDAIRNVSDACGSSADFVVAATNHEVSDAIGPRRIEAAIGAIEDVLRRWKSSVLSEAPSTPRVMRFGSRSSLPSERKILSSVDRIVVAFDQTDQTRRVSAALKMHISVLGPCTDEISSV